MLEKLLERRRRNQFVAQFVASRNRNVGGVVINFGPVGVAIGAAGTMQAITLVNLEKTEAKLEKVVILSKT